MSHILIPTVLINKDHIESVCAGGDQLQRLPLDTPDPGGHGHAVPVSIALAPPPRGFRLLNKPPHRAASYCRRSPMTDVNVAEALVSKVEDIAILR